MQIPTSYKMIAMGGGIVEKIRAGCTREMLQALICGQVGSLLEVISSPDLGSFVVT